MNEFDGKCAEPGCAAFKFDTDAALREGWDVVEGELFCPDHRHIAARTALKVAELKAAMTEIEQKRHLRNHQKARNTLNAAEYRAWDEFQSELVNFHRNHGKLAPRALRLLDPKTFTAIMKAGGKIDVEVQAEALLEAEKKTNATREWLIRRSED